MKTKDFVWAVNSVLCKTDTDRSRTKVLVTSELQENLLRTRIENRTVNALVDTSASVSCISEHLCKQVIYDYQNRLANDPNFLGKSTFNAISLESVHKWSEGFTNISCF